MQIIDKIVDLKIALEPFRLSGQSIGFVPTMGALHKGHISLVETSLKKNKITVVSIFVNPTQFNDKNDLKNYPRNLSDDCDMLRKAGCNYVFAPADEEMYPEPDKRIFDFGTMDKVMEGKHRPGHFNGVGQIVSKLFDAVMPDNAYFGQKDFQQLAIIRKMVSDLHYKIYIETCPIIREADGLAMSSRNMLLGENERIAAPLIFKTLSESKKMVLNHTLGEINSFVEKSINQNPYLKLEYFEAVNTYTLNPINKISGNEPVTACIAVFAGKIRLIDNIEFIS
jgi:pantoate--beta-alanine ligase